MDVLTDNRWYLHHGDCIPHMADDMPPESVDFAVFSPPFPSLFSYTSEACDLGNAMDLKNEAKLHFSFFFKALRRVIKPGRVVIVHCMQIPALARNNQRSTFDFRGLLIRLAERAGLHYQYDWLVTKNPQAQAIRTHSHKLLFVTLERDRSQTCGAMGDYLIKFIAPGENSSPIDSSEITRNEWIDWAEGSWDWHTIRETDTLNTKEAKSEGDTKHICPLQLPVIKRLVKLYTNPNEIVLSPFAGIGSEGYQSLLLERRFYGCEIKDSYYETAVNNLSRAERKQDIQYSLFAGVDDE
jgi:DNA modification methylase